MTLGRVANMVIGRPNAHYITVTDLFVRSDRTHNYLSGHTVFCYILFLKS